MATEPIARKDSGGPYLTMALLCEKVLTEKDGVLSVIRIVDRIISMAVGPGAPEEMPTIKSDLRLVLSFKSGAARGSHSIKIRMEDPTGQQQPTVEFPAHFEGEGDRGVNLIANLVMEYKTPGLYWFDVILGDRLITRLPLRILYQRMSTGTQTGSMGL